MICTRKFGFLSRNLEQQIGYPFSSRISRYIYIYPLLSIAGPESRIHRGGKIPSLLVVQSWLGGQGGKSRAAICSLREVEG